MLKSLAIKAALPLVAGIVFMLGGASAAGADCVAELSYGNHCYAEVQFQPMDGPATPASFDAIQGDVYDNCTHIFQTPPDHYTSATMEQWLLGKQGAWVEDGLVATNYLNGSEQHLRFWADMNASYTNYGVHYSANPFSVGGRERSIVSWVAGTSSNWTATVSSGGFGGTSTGKLSHPAASADGGLEYYGEELQGSTYVPHLNSAAFRGQTQALQWTESGDPALNFTGWTYPFAYSGGNPTLAWDAPLFTSWGTKYTTLNYNLGSC